ncbi:MAG: hypothetical protein ABGX43_02990 [Nitrospinaceae bacterium]
MNGPSGPGGKTLSQTFAGFCEYIWLAILVSEHRCPVQAALCYHNAGTSLKSNYGL